MSFVRTADREPVALPDATPSVDRASRAPSTRFIAIALVAYAVLVGTVSALHEPWKDETQAWRLGLDSHGLAALAHNARYEGHPLLFHLLVMALGHVSRSWWAVAALHAVIACVGAWLVLRYAPFTRVQKVLFIFGYFPAYEYAVVVRPYGLGMVLAFAACVAWTVTRRRVVWTAVLLALLANTSVLGTMLTMAMVLAFGVDWAWPDGAVPRPSRRSVLTVGSAVFLTTTAIVLIAVAQVKPPPDAAYTGEARPVTTLTAWDVASMPTTELRALVPLVQHDDGVMWNRWILHPETKSDLALVLALSLCALLVGCLIASRRRVALLFFVVGTAGYLLFFGLFIPGTAHHHGYLFVVWAIAAWLAWVGPPSEWPRPLRSVADYVDPSRRGLFTLSLLVPVAATIEVAGADALTPFSDAPHAAAVIEENGLGNAPLVAIVRSHAQVLGALLDRPVIYPYEGKTRYFVVWGQESPYAETVRAADSAITALLAGGTCHVVVIASHKQEVSREIASRATLLYSTSYRPMSGDRFRIWVASAPPSPRCPAAVGR